MKIKRSIVAAVILSAMNSSLRADDIPQANPPASPAMTKVTLHMPQAMPEDVFTELSRQGGVKFITNGNLWDQQGLQFDNDIDMTDRPFWSAVNEACGLWNLSCQSSMNYGNNNPKHIQLQYFGLQNNKKTKLPTFETDGFLVQANSFNRQQSINYGQPEQSQNNCSVQLTVFIDPSIHIISFNQNVKVDAAIDDAGNSMKLDGNPTVYYGGMQQRSMIYTANAPLKYPDKPGKAIADLKCTLSMRGSDAMDSLSIDKPLAATESSKEFGDITVVFHSMKKGANGMYEAKVGISKDDDQNGGGNLWGLLQSATLVDGKDRAFTFNGGGGGGGGPEGLSEYTINYSSQNFGNNDETAAGEPVKWTLELPSKSHTIKLPVEFKNLPLP